MDGDFPRWMPVAGLLLCLHAERRKLLRGLRQGRGAGLGDGPVNLDKDIDGSFEGAIEKRVENVQRQESRLDCVEVADKGRQSPGRLGARAGVGRLRRHGFDR